MLAFSIQHLTAKIILTRGWKVEDQFNTKAKGWGPKQYLNLLITFTIDNLLKWSQARDFFLLEGALLHILGQRRVSKEITFIYIYKFWLTQIKPLANHLGYFNLNWTP